MLLKNIGVDVTDITFDNEEVREDSMDGYGYFYISKEVHVEYKIYLPNHALESECVVPFDEYKDMKLYDLKHYLKQRFIDDL